MPAKIRLCRKSDLPKIFRLADGWKLELRGGPAKGENWFTRKQLRKTREYNPKTCWVLEVNGHIEGFRFVYDDTDGRAWGWLLFISKNYRGDGYGTMLFDETRRRLKKLGFRKLYAECDYNNKRVIAWHK